MCVCGGDGVCTSNRRQAGGHGGLYFQVSATKDTEIHGPATRQIECLSLAPGGIHIVFLYIFPLTDLYPHQLERGIQSGFWHRLCSFECPVCLPVSICVVTDEYMYRCVAYVCVHLQGTQSQPCHWLDLRAYSHGNLAAAGFSLP